MKKIPIILTLLLIVAWWYTSWHWYVCNIKGLCNASTYIQTQTVEDTNIVGQDTVNNPISDTTILTANDVLKGDTISDTPKQEIEAEVEVQEEENISEEIVADQEASTLCETPLVGPITFWGNNNIEEVKKLENFLISRWESVTQDGVYWQDALDAVKKFQLEFKSDVLDPWGITTPTGYVWRTTIQKINEIACK